MATVVQITDLDSCSTILNGGENDAKRRSFYFGPGKDLSAAPAASVEMTKYAAKATYIKMGIGKPIPSFLQHLQGSVTKDAENGVKTYKNCKSAMK